jgi:RNA polymerase sigma-70 factor (ECF subfamily)
VLVTVHAVRHTFDPNRLFAPWLVAIAHRRIVDRLRQLSRSRRHETVLDEKYENRAWPERGPHEAVEERDALVNAVESPPSAQRQAISLLKLRELSLKEAVAATGTSVAHSKWQVTEPCTP